jgi:hypothetical protein
MLHTKSCLYQVVSPGPCTPRPTHMAHHSPVQARARHAAEAAEAEEAARQEALRQQAEDLLAEQRALLGFK